MFEFNALGEMGHLLGEYGEASNINFRRATGGNNLCLVSNIADLPTKDNMEPYTLYLHRNETGQLLASSRKKTNIIISDDDLPPGMVKRIKRSVVDISNPPSPKDTKALFGYLSSQKVIAKTFRERMLEISGEAGAILITAINIPLTIVIGSDYTIPLFKDTKARRTITDFVTNLDQKYREYTPVKIAKGWNSLVTGITREIIGPILVTSLNIPITIIAGREQTLPYFKDSFIRNKVFKPSIEAMDKIWSKAKTIIPALSYLDKAVEYKNQLVNSKFTAHVMSIAFGTIAALGLGTGVAFSAPVSIPLIAVSVTGVIIVGAKAEKRRLHHGLYKRYLEDLVIGAATKQQNLEKLRQKIPDISQIIEISDSKLREIEKPKTAMYRAVHSYAERKAGIVALESSPLLVVKGLEAAVNPLGVALEGAATGVRMVSSAEERINESYAKYQLKTEIEVLKKIAPLGTIDNDKRQLANQARNIAIEAYALDKFIAGMEGEKFKSLSNDKLFLKNYFDKCKVEAEQHFISNNDPNYNVDKLVPPSGTIDNFTRKTKEYVGHAFNYLFAKKTSYSEYTSFKPETITLLKAAGHHSIEPHKSLNHAYDLNAEERRAVFHAPPIIRPVIANQQHFQRTN